MLQELGVLQGGTGRVEGEVLVGAGNKQCAQVESVVC